MNRERRNWAQCLAAEDEACKATQWPLPDFKRKHFDSSGFSAWGGGGDVAYHRNGGDSFKDILAVRKLIVNLLIPVHVISCNLQYNDLLSVPCEHLSISS